LYHGFHLFLFADNANAKQIVKGKSKFIDSFIDPESCYRPFVRWWWNGDKVNAKELIRELHLLKEAGIGGVELSDFISVFRG
jgi:hypothetical protein